MPDKDTTPPDHTDLSELREQINELLHIQFERGKAEVNEFAPLWLEKSKRWPTLNDALMQLFKQYAQPPVVADKELDELLRKYGSAITDNTGDAFFQEERIAEAKAALLQREQRLVAAARQEERKIWQPELDYLRRFQEMVFSREALKAGPIKLCAVCSKNIDAAQLRHKTNTGKEE